MAKIFDVWDSNSDTPEPAEKPEPQSKQSYLKCGTWDIDLPKFTSKVTLRKAKEDDGEAVVPYRPPKPRHAGAAAYVRVNLGMDDTEVTFQVVDSEARVAIIQNVQFLPPIMPQITKCLTVTVGALDCASHMTGNWMDQSWLPSQLRSPTRGQPLSSYLTRLPTSLASSPLQFAILVNRAISQEFPCALEPAVTLTVMRLNDYEAARIDKLNTDKVT